MFLMTEAIERAISVLIKFLIMSDDQTDQIIISDEWSDRNFDILNNQRGYACDKITQLRLTQ